jgi:hypothetical protein
MPPPHTAAPGWERLRRLAGQRAGADIWQADGISSWHAGSLGLPPRE